MGRPGFSFFVCPDITILKEEMERQLAAAAPGWQRRLYWGDEEPGGQFWESMRQAGLFAEKRVVIVRQAERWPAAVWKELDQVLARKIEYVWAIFCLEVDFEKGKYKIPAHIQKTSAFAYADKKGWVWRSQGLGQNLQAFVREHAKRLGLVFTPDDFSLFCGRTSADAQGVINELEKLALLAQDGKVKTGYLPENAASMENDAFGLIRCLEAGNLHAAWKELQKDTDGSLLFFLIALLAREFRLLWQIAAGENPRMYPAEVRTKTALARRIGHAGIAEGLAALADAEWQVKSGRQRPEQTLEFLCARMAALFTGGRTSAATGQPL